MEIDSHHIPFARLADYVEGRLGAEERAADRAHLESCRRCAGQSAELERLTALMRADTSEDAPRDVVAGAVGLFRAQAARAADKAPSLLRRLLATLSFDSQQLTPAFGVRSGQAAPARQLLFSAGDVDVDLRLAHGDEGWTVSGQVLGPCKGGRVSLETAGGPEVEAELNSLCEFILPHVPGGSYSLRLRTDDYEVEIPGLELRA